MNRGRFASLALLWAIASCDGANVVASYRLEIRATGDGSTSPAGVTRWASGTAVLVTASPGPGAVLRGWSGAASGTENPVSIAMDANKALVAEFAPAAGEQPSLNIEVVGAGVTDPAPGTHLYALGEEVEVTATPSGGSTFTGWSGAATGTANPVTVAMDADKTLVAHFSGAAVSYALAIDVSGSGATSPATGSHSYPAGTRVQVAATPASGATFTGWSGAATGTANPTTVTMDANKALTASFSAASVTYTLGISVSGSGATSPAAGNHSYSAGTQVQLTATPASGATFTGWSGAVTGTANPATVTMDANKTLTATFSSVGSCTPPAAGSKGTNPIASEVFTADPAAMVDNCTFYIQCGHDEAASGQNQFVMREWFLLSSTDLVHWTRKVAMSLSTFRWANANAWAGQMVKAKNGKYYWYVPVQEASTGAMAIGVATANSPEGPWTDPLGKPLINDEFEMSNMGYAKPEETAFTIDPTVFVDDDGQAYLHYGGFWRLVQAKLNSDMISISGKMQQSTPENYFESPYLIKRNNLYYEIYAAGSNPATIEYATSNSPMGPWQWRGRVLDALPRSSGDTDWPTNHAGVAQFAGQWYIVYHVSDGPNGGGTYRREVAIDKLTFNSDGTIQKVQPSKGISF